MMLPSVLPALALVLWLQGSPPSALPPGDACITPEENRKLSATENIEGRIKIYRQISERLHRAVESTISKQEFDVIPAMLHCWKDRLTASLKDIEAKVNRQKKSGALIDYEIQVRKSIFYVSDARLKAPYTQQDDFDSWIAQAELVRQKFVDILFQR
jgi:hypothetical protein